MKKIVKCIIVISMIILSLCVFPLCLVRKNDILYPTLNVQYGFTETGGELKQVFVAQTAYLSQLAFDIAFLNGKPEEGNLLVRLYEENGKGRMIAEYVVPMQDVQDASFTYIPVEKWIKAGRPYSYVITVKDGTDAAFSAVYTIEEQDAVLGNQDLYLDGEKVAGQGVAAYEYGFPLNYKNVICIWAFIWLSGFILLEIFFKTSLLSNHKWVQKAEAVLNKYQIPILLLEFAAVLLLLIRISRNEAVHWDEAYTWWITGKSLPEMLQTTAADVHPPLYYMLLMAAMGIFGRNIFVAKMVSIAGTAATGLLGVTLVRKNWGVKAAIPFVLVAGLAPGLVFYTVDVRMYSWVSFFVMAAALFAYEIVQTNKKGWWIAFTLAALGGVYTQYFSVVPLAFIYLFLLGWFVIKDRAKIKNWIFCSLATVIGYLPWLTVVIETLKRDAAGTEGESISFGILNLCKWAFGTNIRFSEYMPAIIFLLAVLCLVVEKKKYEKGIAFTVFYGALLFLSYGICMFLAGVMHHFWTDRYLLDALLFIWLFMFLILAKRELVTWGIAMVWLGILMMSSYTIMQATELNTIPWTKDAKQLLEQVQEEEKIVYTFPTFQILYEYYVPNAEFIWYADVDFSEMGDRFYVISWGGNDFSYSLYEQGVLQKEIIGNMRLEEGIWAELWKISVNL